MNKIFGFVMLSVILYKNQFKRLLEVWVIVFWIKEQNKLFWGNILEATDFLFLFC